MKKRLLTLLLMPCLLISSCSSKAIRDDLYYEIDFKETFFDD